MQIVRTTSEMAALAAQWRKDNKTVGLVPTMGALHAGHISLVDYAKAECDIAVASVFVNPSQFGPNEDFDKYPRTEAADIEKLEAAHCDVAFIPSPAEMYPEGFCTWVNVTAAPADRLEGKLRPIHFQGVATVVLKLFNLTQATKSYFGQKDFQQVQVVKRMVNDLNVPVEIIRCPIVREPEGLAISSRNRYMSDAETEEALCLSRALKKAKELACTGEYTVAQIADAMREIVSEPKDASVDYAILVEGENLDPVPETDVVKPELWQDKELVALLAVRIGTTRLIDNEVLL
jgi:pantoate--beta-alanine ligase